MSSSSIFSTILAQRVHNLHVLHTASVSSSQSQSPPQTKHKWRPTSRAGAAASAAATVTAMAVCIIALVSCSVAAAAAAAAFQTSPCLPRQQSYYSSSSTLIQATHIAEQETVVLKTTNSRQRQQRQSSLQNRNNLERLYSLDEFRFNEKNMEQQREEMTRAMKVVKKQTSTPKSSSTSTSTSTVAMPPVPLSPVKVVKGRNNFDSTTRRRRSSMSMAMKNSDATATTTAAAVASTLEDLPSSSTVQFKGLSTTGYRGNRKFPLPPPAAAAAFKKTHRSTLTSNTTMMMTTTTTTTTRTRSSTMPGFLAAQSDKQRAFRDGIRVAEQQSGHKFVDTTDSAASRRRTNGENMYKNSASVPDSMTQFAQEIHQQGRISRQEEIALGTTVQEAIRLHRNLEALRQELGREATDEEWCAAAGKINMQAIREAIDEGLQAKNKLVTSNLRMVQSVVNTYIRNGLTAQYNAGDLMQEGIMALIRAAEKFEPDRGWKFSTYAMYWVRASVKRNQIYQSRVITVPQRLYESHKRLLRVGKELEVVLERKPTNQELGAAVGMTGQQVERCFTAMEQRCFSLDQEINNSKKPMTHDSNKNRLVDVIMDSKSPDDNVQRMQFLRQDIIETLHRQLSPEEVDLLLFRYGLKDLPSGSGSSTITSIKNMGGSGQPTIAELSRAVGLKPDKVRRIINKALHQLRSSTVQSDEWLALERELSR